LKNKTGNSASAVTNSVIVDETPANPEMFNNYVEAGKLADSAMKFAASQIKSDASVFQICRAVDAEMAKLCESFKGAAVSFPCAISPNDLICHYSPTSTDPEIILKSGDLVKIELGIHVDNCPAFICRSLVVDGEESETSSALLKAALTAAQATARDLRPGQILDELTDKFANIPAEFGVNYTQGLMTHVISRNNLAGDKGLVYRPTAEQRKSAGNAAVEENELYLVDVVVSSGQYAVARPTTHRTSIYKKSGSVQALRFKSSRQFISEIGQKYGLMAFTLRNFSNNEARARVALKECLAAELVHSYDVIADLDEKALTARFAFTLIVGKDANVIVTNSQ
jgi:curved DNA binding protein